MIRPVTGNSAAGPSSSLAQCERSTRNCTARALVVLTQADTGIDVRSEIALVKPRLARNAAGLAFPFDEPDRLVVEIRTCRRPAHSWPRPRAGLRTRRSVGADKAARLAGDRPAGPALRASQTAWRRGAFQELVTGRARSVNGRLLTVAHQPKVNPRPFPGALQGPVHFVGPFKQDRARPSKRNGRASQAEFDSGLERIAIGSNLAVSVGQVPERPVGQIRLTIARKPSAEKRRKPGAGPAAMPNPIRTPCRPARRWRRNSAAGILA